MVDSSSKSNDHRQKLHLTLIAVVFSFAGSFSTSQAIRTSLARAAWRPPLRVVGVGAFMSWIRNYLLVVTALLTLAAIREILSSCLPVSGKLSGAPAG